MARLKVGEMPARRTFHHQSIEERRGALLEATLDAVAELGLRGATVREIAKRAGVTPGLIRHYFDNKELMFQVAYRQVVNTMFEEMRIIAENAESSARRRLRTYILSCFRTPMIDTRNVTLWATFVSQVSVDPALAAIHNERYLASRDWLQDQIFRSLHDEGRSITEAEARTLSIAVNGLIDGLWLEATMAPTLFGEGELSSIALVSAGGVLGLSLTD